MSKVKVFAKLEKQKNYRTLLTPSAVKNPKVSDNSTDEERYLASLVHDQADRARFVGNDQYVFIYLSTPAKPIPPPLTPQHSSYPSSPQMKECVQLRRSFLLKCPNAQIEAYNYA